ncbi:MAG TPA: DUF1648 domain-containing protein [Thermoanaerobacterales bacterium]|nr:DUF1648 domain-containing protein [Thermoanaerobacterales bacterium]
MSQKTKFRLPVSWIVIALILGLYILGFILYPSLPGMMPSHWNLSGRVDSYMPKTWYLIFFPTLILVLYLLMSFAPIIDPKAENYKKFSGVYQGFRALITLVMAGIYVATLLYALGIPISVAKVVIFALGIMLTFTGNYFGKVRYNYTFGIKTPWTLASEEVWNKTHRISGPLWVMAGLVWIFSIFLPDKTAFVVDMAALMAATLYGFVYSFMLYNKLDGK